METGKPQAHQKESLTKVITYGTFDTFHIGHLNILKRAKEMGDYLIVGLSTDEFTSMKGKQTILPYHERKAILQELKCVDRVIPETSWEQKEKDIKNLGIDTFVMGDDWQGEFDDLPCKVVYLPRTPYISTTKIKHATKV